MTHAPDSSASGEGPAATRTSASPYATRLAAFFVFVFGFLPLANWIRGGLEADWFGAVASGWVYGSLIAVGGGVALAILSRRLPLWREGLWSGVARRAHERPGVTGALIALLGFVVYCTIALRVLSGHPIFIDEISQLFQARIFASGRLWLEAPRHPEFTSIMHVLDADGKWFSQFPPGGPLMMVPAVWMGATWLAGPMAGAGAAALFWGIARRIEAGRGASLGAALLFALSPFVAFLAGSHMNHVSTALWILLAVYALVRLEEDDRRPTAMAALCGMSFGAAASIRPVDALAFALPAGVWMLMRAKREPRRWRDVLVAGTAMAIPLAAILWFNARTTGNPLLFAYEKLWGTAHGLGFHRSPWGSVHTPVRGVELINLYMLRLQSYMFEAPLPSLSAATVALVLARRIGKGDRYLLAASATLLALYFAYWHDGFYLGPRFVYLLSPVLALWTARLPEGVRESFPGAPLARRATVFAMAIAGLVAVTSSIPSRSEQYRRGLASTRFDFTSVAARAGVSGALIFVRESWGSQLMARMWSLGASRSEAELLYRSVDACQLELRLSALERDGVSGGSAFEHLRPLLRDSARVVRSELSPDRTERVLPGMPYDRRCQERLNDDRAGFTLFAPLLAEDWGTNIYARDLHGRDSLLVRQFPGRPIYLMRPVFSRGDESPQLERLNTDSLLASWRTPDQ